MLTPIEIQGITFKNGRGYKKDDVDSFMKALYHDYEIMYKENQELKDKVTTLSDGIQYYKNLEKTLQKALVLAEKTSEETKEAAKRQAEALEEEARLKAEKLLLEAKQEYNKIEAKTKELMQNFELYKSQFKQIAKTQLELLESESFEIHEKEFDFHLEQQEQQQDKLGAGLEKALDVDKAEVSAAEEEKLQEEILAMQVAMETEKAEEEKEVKEKEAEEAESEEAPSSEMQKESSEIQSKETQSEETQGDDMQVQLEEEDFRVNLDGILDDSVKSETVQEKSEQSAAPKQEAQEPADTETELEIKMLQKLLHEIKKNNESVTDDEEFEFINTESDD